MYVMYHRQQQTKTKTYNINETGHHRCTIAAAQYHSSVDSTSNCKVSWTTKSYKLPVLGCLIRRLMCFVPFEIKCVLKLCSLVVQTRIGHPTTRFHKNYACAYNIQPGLKCETKIWFATLLKQKTCIIKTKLDS